MNPVIIAIDRSGNMEHQAGNMLDVLRCLLEKTPCVVTIFDSERGEPKYFCNVSYQPIDGEAA